MNKIVLILVPVLLLVIVGVVVFLGMSGIVNIPGLTKKSAKAGAQYGEGKENLKGKKAPPKVEEKALELKPDPTPIPVPQPKTDDKAGAEKVAGLWNRMTPEQIVAVCKDWTDREIAKVMVQMKEQKVAETMSLFPPKKASTITRAIQLEASKVDPSAEE